MKTLDQVEPRIAVNSANTPGAADYQHRITEAGSYYLTGNLTFTAPAGGIQITAPGVTLDLNGFEIRRESGAGVGIRVTDAAKGVQIRNGSVRGATVGITISGGATGFALRNLVVRECTEGGILALARGGEISSVRATNNTGSNGIITGHGAVIVDTIVSENNVSNAALSAGDGSTLRGCMARSNEAPVGTALGGGSTLLNCAASSNTGAGNFGWDPSCRWQLRRRLHCKRQQDNCGRPDGTDRRGFCGRKSLSGAQLRRGAKHR